MALLRPPSAMAVPRGQATSPVAPPYDMVAFVCSADCWTHADNSLLFAYELLRGSLEPERGNSRGYVQMMALAIYLEQQNVQGTPFWPETTQHLFAAMAFNDAVGAALPAVKRPSQQKRLKPQNPRSSLTKQYLNNPHVQTICPILTVYVIIQFVPGKKSFWKTEDVENVQMARGQPVTR